MRIPRFANAKGGKIFIGKNDKGEVTGVENHKRLMDDIPNKIQTLLGIICDVDFSVRYKKGRRDITSFPAAFY